MTDDTLMEMLARRYPISYELGYTRLTARVFMLLGLIVGTLVSSWLLILVWGIYLILAAIWDSIRAEKKVQ